MYEYMSGASDAVDIRNRLIQKRKKQTKHTQSEKKKGLTTMQESQCILINYYKSVCVFFFPFIPALYHLLVIVLFLFQRDFKKQTRPVEWSGLVSSFLSIYIF